MIDDFGFGETDVCSRFGIRLLAKATPDTDERPFLDGSRDRCRVDADRTNVTCTGQRVVAQTTGQEHPSRFHDPSRKLHILGRLSPLAALLTLVIGAVPPTIAAPAGEIKMNDATDCTLLFDFTRAADRDAWREQNDTVMGGNSRGRIEQTGDSLVFAGDLVTRDGGFVQMQARLPDGALTGMTGLRLVASGDARPWRVRITTDTRVPRTAMGGRGDAPIGESGVEMDGPRVAFAAPVRNLGTGDPASATVSMADSDPSVRGRPVPGAVWDASRARSMGLILSDGRDAPFRLVVRRIEVCR